MHTEIVKPATGRFEGVYLLLVSAVILSVCTVLIWQRQTTLETQPLQPYQLSAFNDLSKTEQAVFNDLYAAALELQSVHRDNKTWLSIEDIQDLGMPPFADAPQNKTRGGHQWTAIPMESADSSQMAYFGKSARLGEARSFLLVMTYQASAVTQSDPNTGRSFSIWVNGNASVEAPKAMGVSGLVDLGWREAVALKGEQVQRGITAGAQK